MIRHSQALKYRHSLLLGACEPLLAQSFPRKPMRALPLGRSLLALLDMPIRRPIPAHPYVSTRRLRSEGRQACVFQIAASFQQKSIRDSCRKNR